MAYILIVDDDAAFREGLRETLESLGHQVVEAGNGQEGLDLLLTGMSVQLIFVDLRMPVLDGLGFIAQLHRRQPERRIPLVMLTAYAGAGNTIEAMKLGAFDHLAKPLGREDIRAVVERALAAQPERDEPAPPASAQETAGDELIGSSAAMRDVQKLIGMAAASDVTVLISGETGTGKELVARQLHRASDRAREPFVALNCAAIPAELLESELFGHSKGAFSGAYSERMGSFREADGGTLFLDEIGDMPLPMQAKILRALQEREITPVGADRRVHVDVRVITASHHDLPEAVREGRFREDLFFRLNVLPIHLPALRDRPGDIITLAEYFLASLGQPNPKQLLPAAARALLRYRWPGNVRELRNAMQRAQVISRSGALAEQDFAFLLASDERSSFDLDGLAHLPLPEAVAAVEAWRIRQALAACRGNRAETARSLGIHRQLLYSKLRLYGLADD
ncbi:sigma-54-dependent transcriptional regulator [Pseudomonas sp. UBA2684]|uniref:sigma-54-dependent transcriptional regulator n=1 Tax=Pseudomonas sp. UBA2684 TaxID=1947311 RepID=UPI000E90488E|nr:sigma-54 dependent transcriptional regulator [Pseudomonas sp. UBA2684]HBX57313.1 sigma-54-dependent Fis family transcriptional regulator [Pseudomonas sp.]|tara:strand:- start:9131 stop:10489 length:1359 start_codon:yes stop_codon:yes gene_type:complete